MRLGQKEVGREPLGRKLLGREVVLYRKESGEPVAIGGTPETEHTAHYFYGLTRTHRIRDPEADEAARQWHLRGFSQQDKPIIEAAARLMGNETDPLALGAAGIETDGGNLRARRILKNRIELEGLQEK